jgi:phosphoglucosamine mutase
VFNVKIRIMQLFGTSGIRRLADINLLQLAVQVGLAIGTTYKNVIIGRDTRTSGYALSLAVTSGLLFAGARCSDAGILPTPTLAYATRKFDAGIMVTASHNPPQYNGLKLLNPDGSAFTSIQQKQIENFVNGITPLDIQWEKMQSGELYTAAVEEHVNRIVQDFPSGVKLKAVVDCGCGAAYFITRHLLNRLGCEVIDLNCYPCGLFPHDIEPIEANLGNLIRAVKETGANLGIAHDGDADRMMAVDDLGRFISGDRMLAILAQFSGSKDIVTTIDASMGIEHLGFNIKRTRVGDPYVSEELKQWGGFGGEPSGAWVFPSISLCPDGIYAAALIAHIAGQSKLSELVNAVPDYPIMRSSISGTISNNRDIREKLESALDPLSVDTIDGLKLNLKDGWILVRPSGTEPKIRLTSEAKDEALARHYLEIGSRIIKENISSY